MEIIQKKTSNFWKGRNGHQPIAFVIHIMEGSLIGTDSWFENPQSKVSAHFGIGKNGEIHQYVDVADSAWQAGVVNKPTWKLLKKNLLGIAINPNYYTIGIENEGHAGDRWTEGQMNSICDIVRTFGAGIVVSRDTIVSHNEISSYKENMGAWCDEIVKRLNPTIPVPTVDIAGAVDLLYQAINKLKLT